METMMVLTPPTFQLTAAQTVQAEEPRNAPTLRKVLVSVRCSPNSSCKRWGQSMPPTHVQTHWWRSIWWKSPDWVRGWLEFGSRISVARTRRRLFNMRQRAFNSSSNSTKQCRSDPMWVIVNCTPPPLPPPSPVPPPPPLVYPMTILNTIITIFHPSSYN